MTPLRTAIDDLAEERGYRYEPDLGLRPVRFIERFCRQSQGKWRDKPLELLPWQRDFLMKLFGWLGPDGTRRFRRAYLEVGKKNGKALALDTPIPTPDGFARMDDLRPGDTVFDESGMPCRVLATTEVMHNRPCYEVVFSDGERITADAEHEWFVSSRTDRGRSSVKTTAELAIQPWLDYKSSEGANHRIPLAAPLQLPEAILPVDPYVLGAWLGDGHSASARITCSYSDLQIIEEIRACGVPAREGLSPNANTGLFCLSEGRGGDQADKIQTLLRRMGLLNKKHIPPVYLWASQAQRLALLQGLMDTDGHCTPRGQCEFTTTSKVLCEGFLQLARSLGFKPTLKIGNATLVGRIIGPKYRIQFWAFADTPAFRLRRKRERQKPRPIGRARSQTRHIVDVIPRESVPVKCIQVDSPSSLYLAGYSMIPTHNSTLVSALVLYLLLADQEGGPKVFLNAYDRAQARIVFDEAMNMVEASPDLSRRLEVISSRNTIVDHKGKGWIRANSSEVDSQDGANASAVIFDELHRQPDRKMWNIFRYAGVSRLQPLTLSITTAGEDSEGIWHEQREYSEKVASGEIQDLTHFGLVFRALDSDDIDDPATWEKANPSLGHTLTREGFATDLAEAKLSPAELASFKRLRLNIITREEGKYLPVGAWEALHCDSDYRSGHGETGSGLVSYMGADLSSVSDLTALVTLFGDADNGYDLLSRFWLPADDIVALERRDRVPYRAWADAGYLTLTEGNVIDYESVRAEIDLQAARYDVQKLLIDPHNATQLGLQLLQDGHPVEFLRQGYLSLNAPTKELLRLILSKQLRHDDNPVMRWCINNAVAEKDPAGNIKLSKKKSRLKIDGAAALVNALAGAMTAEGSGSVYDTRGVILL